jgi:hypothetical protein
VIEVRLGIGEEAEFEGARLEPCRNESGELGFSPWGNSLVVVKSEVPQWLKPRKNNAVTARLKPCPFKQD